jgi:hypothetical protein
MASCLKQEPSLRPTLDEVVGALERMLDAWISCYDDLELPPGTGTERLGSKAAGKPVCVQPS